MEKIKGIIVPAGWDETGKVVDVAISTRNEEEYLIHKNEKGEELLAHQREEVELEGFLEKKKNGQVIVVNNYHLTSSFRSHAVF